MRAQLTLLAAAVLLVSCREEHTESPDRDAGGSGFFGCGIDDQVAFDALGGQVVQATNEAWCVRVDRAPLDPAARRGQEWELTQLRVQGPDINIDVTPPRASYVVSHHNCLDQVVVEAQPAQPAATIIIDGTGDAGEDVCFSGTGSWVIRLDVDALPTQELDPVDEASAHED
jgi:hypothetical protein